MGSAPRALFAGALGIAAAFLVACGGGASGLLSSDQAGNLSNHLDQLSSDVGSGNCGAAAGDVSALNNAIDNLPSSVNPALSANLKQGAATVSQLSVQDCRTSTTTTSSTSTPSSTTSTTTTSTPTSTPTSTSTTSSTGSHTSAGGGSGGAGLGGGGGNSGGAGPGGGNGQ